MFFNQVEGLTISDKVYLLWFQICAAKYNGRRNRTKHLFKLRRNDRSK